MSLIVPEVKPQTVQTGLYVGLSLCHVESHGA